MSGCPRCGHPYASHAPNPLLDGTPVICSEVDSGAECGCPLLAALHLEHVGNVEVRTEHGTSYYLRDLGGHDPRWYRVPGSAASTTAFAYRWNRLGALHGVRRGEALRVGCHFTVGIGSFSDLIDASRIVWMRATHRDDLPTAAPVPVEAELALVAAGWDPADIAAWWRAPNGRLPDAATPQRHMEIDTAAVMDAVQQAAAGPV